MTWWKRMEQVTKLAEVDESQPYEVDQTAIVYDPATSKYALLTASGCSCWDGDFDEQTFDSLDEIEQVLLNDGSTSRYNPSLSAARELMTDARAADVKRVAR